MAIPSTFRNLVLVLSLVGLAAALGLGGVSVLTREPIEQAKQQKVINALKDVLPEFDNDPSSEIREIEMDGGVLKVYSAQRDGQWVGSAVESFSNNGFGGFISVMVGFDSSGQIYGYSVLHQAETPGLGDRMVDWFKPQGEPEVSLVEKLFGFRMPVVEPNSNIIGKNPSSSSLTVSNDGGEIDAITAATISSRAFLDAVNRAYKGFDMNADISTGTTSSSTSTSEVEQ